MLINGLIRSRAAGYTVGTQPRVGAVICWPYGGWGYWTAVGLLLLVEIIQAQRINYNESIYRKLPWLVYSGISKPHLSEFIENKKGV